MKLSNPCSNWLFVMGLGGSGYSLELVVKVGRRGEVRSGKANAIGVVLEVEWEGKLLVEVSNL